MKKTIFGPAFAAVGAVLLFSTGGLCIKSLSLTALPLAGLRSAIAAVFLGIYLVRRTPDHYLPRISGAGLVAAVAYFGMTVTYVLSMKMTTAANAIFLQYTMPAWVLIGGAVLLGERITAGRLVSIFLSLLGMFLFFIDDLSPQQWLGNCFALASGFGYAVVALALRKDRDSNPAGAVFWGNAITAVIVIPSALYFLPETAGQLAGWRPWLVLLWLGVVQIGVAYLLLVSALKYLPAVEVAIITLIEPLLNPFWVFLYNREIPGMWANIGGAIILLSVVLRSMFRGNGKDDTPDAECPA